MSPPVRKARPEDMDAIYLMGRDAWGAGRTIPDYLDSCRKSEKYKEGEWFLLVDEDRSPAASLIVYRVFSDDAGIGSIAVAPENRGRGLATRLIRGVLKRLDRRGFKRVFLFSDIAARFYEPFGFKPLPARHQKRPGSVCMVRARSTRRLLAPGFTPPDYF